MSAIIEAVESFLCKIHPELLAPRELVPDEDIARLEEFFPLPLPPFYRWFLARFGRDIRPFRYEIYDFSIDGLIAEYESELPDPIEDPEEYAITSRVQEPGWCKIAHSLCPPMPSIYYDLNYPVRDDARITSGGTPWSETFYEHLLVVECHHVYGPRFAQFREGSLRCEEGKITEKMAAFARSWDFTPVVPSGIQTTVMGHPNGSIMFWSKSFSNDTNLHFELATNTPAFGKRLIGELAMSDELILLGRYGHRPK